MPEAPEVETIVRDLNKKILGQRIIGVWTDWSKMIKTGFKMLEKDIKGAKIEKAHRRGKNILIDLSKPSAKSQKLKANRYLLVIHQKMTGHLLVGKWKIERVTNNKQQITSLIKGLLQERVNDFIHLIFYLDDGRQLALSDMRKFAKVLFGPTREIENSKDLRSLGIDPIDSKTQFKDFASVINKRTRNIKQVLMDQTVITGVGNIYADDILWSAKIHPLKKASDLNPKEIKGIWSATREILKKAIKLRGTSTADFRDTSGKKGRYGDVRLAYQRTSEPCRRCRTPIKRIKIGGRSAHFCPNCQKL